MRYLCLVYAERTTLPLAEAPAFSAAQCIVAHDLEPAASAASVRVRGNEVLVGGGADDPERLIGFCLLEARDLNDAIHSAARIPAARVGSIEVRAVRPPSI